MRGGECAGGRVAEDVAGALGVGDGDGVGGDRAEHAELVLGLVDEAASGAEVLAVDLSGDVEDGCAGAQGFDEGSGGVARSGTGAGEGAAEVAGGAGVAVGGVDGCGFVADGDEAEVSVDGFDERQVVHADDAEHRVDAECAQRLDEQVAAVGSGHVGCSWGVVGVRGYATARLTPPQTSMVVPVMYEALGDRSAVTAYATSSALPRRPSAMPRSAASAVCQAV